MNESLLSIINLKSKYIIIKIHDDKSEDIVYFNISNWTMTYIE